MRRPIRPVVLGGRREERGDRDVGAASIEVDHPDVGEDELVNREAVVGRPGGHLRVACEEGGLARSNVLATGLGQHAGERDLGAARLLRVEGRAREAARAVEGGFGDSEGGRPGGRRPHDVEEEATGRAARVHALSIRIRGDFGDGRLPARFVEMGEIPPGRHVGDPTRSVGCGRRVLEGHLPEGEH